jgi:hypothetical protein
MKSIYQRVKDKKLRDFIVHAKRKLFLFNVKKSHGKYGHNYFYSNPYLKKHINGGISSEVISEFKQSSSGLFGDLDELKARIQDSIKNNENTFEEIIGFANTALSHQFDLLGSGLTELNYPAKPVGIMGTLYQWERYSAPTVSTLVHSSYRCIDWHIDFKSGYRWNPDSYYPVSRIYSKTIGADIKVPWELSRALHLPMVGLAYLATGKKIYAEEIYSQIIDWIVNNPLCKGPNWNCPMDVGIRVANWLVALELVRTYEHEKNDKRLRVIIASLVQHTDYLWNNFEWSSKLTSNHYLSNLAGFLFCVTYIPKLINAKRFTCYVKNQFQIEIRKQMYTDGMNSEGSVPYHRLVMEMLAYSHILAKKNEIAFNVDYDKQLFRSFEFTGAIMHSDGGMPQIGDNDAGVFLRLYPRNLTDYSYLNALCQITTNKKIHNAHETEGIEHLLFDSPRLVSEVSEPLFRNFKESGISIVKNKDFYFSFYHGLNGQKGNGGHCHNDRLSFTLTYKNQDIFVDPGSGVYTPFPKIRNQFRATNSHNTVEVSGEEQNNFYKNGYLFAINENITEVDTCIVSEKENIKIKASHNGYQRKGIEAYHKRVIDINHSNLTFTIRDSVETKQELISKLIFIVKRYPGFSYKETCNGFMTKDVKVTFSKIIGIQVEDIDYSPSYGNIEKNGALRIMVSFENKVDTNIRLIK